MEAMREVIPSSHQNPNLAAHNLISCTPIIRVQMARSALTPRGRVNIFSHANVMLVP